ncbi:YibE/F family protein [Anaerovorax odorimutans]|uniref:YibE/F family protein n=1 Tax=Anaerovorax odorimutans TaxID=109327 RepID=UPI0004288C24|nr:YibE/F family protein [Anaerovorax odorimutans]
MIKILAIILVILLLVIGGERGAATLVSLFWNILILTVSIFVMGWGINPIIVTAVSSVLISNSTLFYQNGKNVKTIASFWSVLIVILLLFIVIYKMCYSANLRGLNEIIQNEDEVFGFSLDININMAKIAISMIIIGLIGAAIDSAIAVSSAVYEVYKNNRHLNVKELFASGIAIGRDILGTMVNTLYFAYIGESLMLFLLFKNFNYSILEMINSKAFFQGFASIIFSGIGCVVIIPITAIITSYLLKNPQKFKRLLDEDELFKEQELN